MADGRWLKGKSKQLAASCNLLAAANCQLLVATLHFPASLSYFAATFTPLNPLTYL